MEVKTLGWEKIKVGRFGERVALEFLKRKGYKVLETNFRTPFGELDLVARKKDFTVFVEIKTRTTSSLGPPYLSVTRMKQAHLIKNALCYLKRYGLVDSNWRIDIVSVKLNCEYEAEDIEIIENAVEEF